MVRFFMNQCQIFFFHVFYFDLNASKYVYQVPTVWDIFIYKTKEEECADKSLNVCSGWTN